ncbi:MAG: hypothetical protein ACF8R7_15890 [Phycisphaerales bacterium JB039]
MGANLPRNPLDQIQWFENRLADWAVDPTLIGLTALQVSDLSTMVGQARAAYDNTQAIRDTSKAATTAYKSAVAEMRAFGADLIATIKAYAETTADPGVYETAQVSPRDPAGAVPPPEQPQNLTTLLRNDGSIELRWKAAQPSGTRYIIYRRLGPVGSFAVIGDAGGAKSFIDGGVPAGTASATYYIVAKRGDSASAPSEQAIMPLGAGNGESEGLSLAA